jgi:hypothetical protein
MNICAENKAVGLDVRNFLIHVPNVNEESITDYLVWKWEEINDAAKFRCLNVGKFTRQDEHDRTGADFELELWILSPQPPISLIFQAKKFTEETQGYVSKLKYPNNTKYQLDTLLKYADDPKHKRKPFYMIYSPADAQTKTGCANCNNNETGMYMIEAKTIEKFANLPPHSRLSLTEILAESLPFHCMFCCSMNLHEYFARFFSTENQTEQVFPSENPLPRYVKDMLSGELNSDNNYELPPARWVAVYDTRFEREE